MGTFLVCKDCLFHCFQYLLFIDKVLLKMLIFLRLIRVKELKGCAIGVQGAFAIMDMISYFVDGDKSSTLTLNSLFTYILCKASDSTPS